MADVRSLLRSEKASRRIQHPHATYSTTGALVCVACQIQLKSESLWDRHLRSAEHATRLQRIRDGTLGRPPEAAASANKSQGGRKRKADELGEEGERKKAKAVLKGVPADFFDGALREGVGSRTVGQNQVPEGKADERPPESIMSPGTEHQTLDLQSGPTQSPPKAAPVGNETVDEDEWAAFERDVATPPPETSVPAALTAAATISAAPLSSAELAAQRRLEESTQKKELKEAELEAEKEDAAKQLEDEFDQMEELESRVRRLREKRETLRSRKVDDAGIDISQKGTNAGAAPDDDDQEEDDSDDDDWDGWRLSS